MNEFYIKTFQVFDSSGNEKTAPIMTESVFGNFEPIRLYDTSILARGKRLYYFKRLYENPQSEDFMSATNDDMPQYNQDM